MEFFRIRRDIPFMRHALVFNIISLVTFLAAVFFLATRGLHFSIEFTGGIVMQTSYSQTAEVEKIRANVEKLNFGEVQVQNFGSSRDVIIRLPANRNTKQTEVAAAVFDTLCKAESGSVSVRQVVTDKGETVSRPVCSAGTAEPVQQRSVEYVGPQVGSELAINGAYALAAVVIGIVIYLAIRFELKFAIAALATTLHDVVLVAGWFAISGHEFDLTVLAGILSVMGYSINDTIVVFDRVRENFRTLHKLSPAEVLNRSINQTLSRTIITSFVAFLTVLALYIFAGASLRGMAETQIIGIVIGTLSSIFVACPLLQVFRATKQDLLPKMRDEAELARRP